MALHRVAPYSLLNLQLFQSPKCSTLGIPKPLNIFTDVVETAIYDKHCKNKLLNYGHSKCQTEDVSGCESMGI